MNKWGWRRGRSTVASLLVAGMLSGTGCLRFAYSDVDRQHGHTQDAAMEGGQPPALASDAGRLQGDGQVAGNASAGARAGADAVGGAGPGQAGASGFDAATRDASALDAGFQDAQLPEAGSVDAGSGDAGAAGGVPGMDWTPACWQRTGVLLCNGFENSALDYTWDYAIMQNGTAEASTTIRHAGARAVRASTYSALEGTAVRYSSSILNQQLSGDIWMRFYYYVPSTTEITTWFSSGVISEIAEPYQGFSLLIRANYVEIESMLGYFNDGVPFPRDRWVCVELHAHVHSSSGYFEAFLDSTSVARSGPGDTVPASGYSAAEFGIHYAEYRQGPVVVYLDDAALGTARIGCD